MLLLISALFVFAALLYVSAPLRRQGCPLNVSEFAARQDSDNLNDARERFLQMHRDLELDFSLGKLEEAEFLTQKNLIERELLNLLNKLDQVNAG